MPVTYLARSIRLPVLIERLTGELIVSCQPVVGGPLDRPEFVVGFARAAEAGGAAGLRIEGLANLRAVRAATALPIIGIVKRQIPSSPVFITPEPADVAALAEAGADIVAFDATRRPRPTSVKDLLAAVHGAGKLAMADVASVAEAEAAVRAGTDIVGTTLSGYTGGPAPEAPDIDLVAACVGLGKPVFAEGRYRTTGQVAAAIAAGADAIVVGSAITRPEHVTEWFVTAVRAAFRSAHATAGPAARGAGRPVLAVDLGGTKTLIALVSGGAIVASERVATPKEQGPEAWLDAIADEAADWRERFAAAAVAVTGLVKDGRWWSLNPAVLPIPPGFPLVDELSRRLGVPVTAMNDAQAAAWGEFRHGAGHGCDTVFLTVSTGIGGGIVLGGRLLTGRGGLGGHVGQMLVGVSGETARFEDVASGGALRREALAAGHDVDSEAIFLAAAAGEPWAERLIEASADRLALGLRSLQMLVDPDCFVIGGGVGLAPGYLDRVREHLSVLPDELRPELRPAALGANAGLIGVTDFSQSQLLQTGG
jgi:N-acetylmannosamine-6-phosphate 2-epimerase / N-acetylmannosamine kinase